MKKNLNVIQVRGMRGLLLLIAAGCCLAAGFIAFPGWIAMHIWNFISVYCENMPAIGLVQGILLWGIIVASYFTFKKDRLVICVKTPQGLSEDELKAVFADLKKDAEEDKILQAMIKARETELKLKNSEESKAEEEQKTEIK